MTQSWDTNSPNGENSRISLLQEMNQVKKQLIEVQKQTIKELKEELERIRNDKYRIHFN